MGRKQPQPEDITLQEFQDALGRYEALIGRVSDSKGAKAGQKTLAELDKYRYEEAVQIFGSGDPKRLMGIDEVKTLVEWKLRHGKFRPTLMKLVSSNDTTAVKDTIQEAVGLYKKTADTAAALNVLTKLKGIGPATASLLLAVHDPERVAFFADEAFYWLCSGGRKSPIKYNAKEYQALHEETQKLRDRLGVRAVDVERVTYVILNERGEESPARVEDSKSRAAEEPGAKTSKQPVAKRKKEPVEETKEAVTSARRSKRTKRSS
ncbi:DUF1479 domain protein [Pleurostoma richardsiae]|uniref:DUF1479 domain protein n=1 Tax=Pleurostoma richardsiae TaxID=41990 RepID=A0AA38VD00_9PEZI|nr:DUF1479 domain protein [Pleurostoma richardsiae]